MIEVGVHLPTTAIGRRIPAPLGMPRDEVLIGRAARGGDVIWRPDDNGRAHLFIAGRTGGGKGVSSNDVLAHATAAGWRIVVLNPKKAGEFRWLGSSASIAETPTGMFKALEWVRLEMERRADILDDVSASPPGPTSPSRSSPGIAWITGSCCSSTKSSASPP